MRPLTKAILIITVFLQCAFVWSQNKQLLYNVDALPQSLMSNPAIDVSFDRHYGLPFVSQIHTNFGSTGFNVFDFFQESQTSTLNSRIRDVLNRLSTNDYIKLNFQTEMFSFGTRHKKGTYISGGLYLEGDGIIYMPKNFALLAYEGASGRNLNKPFSFEEIFAQAEAVAVWHIGFSKKINKKLRFGARAKIYSGLVDFRSTNNTGTFITTDNNDNGTNIYRHSLIDADIRVQTSGVAELTSTEDIDQGEITNTLRNRIFFGGNLGLGVDFGFTYALNDKMTLSGSVIDLGFIRHSKDVEVYRISGTYDLDGVELDFPQTSGNAAPPYYEELKDEIEREVPLDTLYTKYTTWRPLKLNAGFNYGFDAETPDCNCYGYDASNRYNNNVGLHIYAIKRPKQIHTAATLYYDKRIASYLRAKVTYTIDSFSYKNIGALISTQGKTFNFYFGVDNMLDFNNVAKLNSISLQLGLQFIITQDK